jgi:uncharacterized membrane-anchored protein
MKPDFQNVGNGRVQPLLASTKRQISTISSGLLGVAAGDLIHHNIGLHNASVALCLLLTALILTRETSASVSMLLFWSIVMAERCAGTAVREVLASRRAVGLGVPIASA